MQLDREHLQQQVATLKLESGQQLQQLQQQVGNQEFLPNLASRIKNCLSAFLLLSSPGKSVHHHGLPITWAPCRLVDALFPARQVEELKTKVSVVVRCLMSKSITEQQATQELQELGCDVQFIDPATPSR